MRLELTIPMRLLGRNELTDALDAVDGSTEAKDLLRPLLEIVRRALSASVQQDFFDDFPSYAADETLPWHGDRDIRLSLDVPVERITPLQGELVDIAMAGSEWIWQSTSDGQAAAVFEVLCDILEEALPVGEQQPLLNANLDDLAG